LAALQQLVLVTADSEVLAWARLEAMTGAVGVVTAPPPSQPAASHDGEQPAATAPGAHP